MKEKTFYLVSALRGDSMPAGNLKRHDTEKEAIETAKGIIEKRARDGHPSMGFYILKAQCLVDIERPKVHVSKLGAK